MTNEDGYATTLASAENQSEDETQDAFALVRNYWQRKNHAVLLTAQTGTSIKTLALQLGLAFSIGKPLFGFTPARALRVGIVLRGWTDKRALYIFRRNVAKVLQDTEGWTAEETQQALQRLDLLKIYAGYTGSDFFLRLQQIQGSKGYDLLLLTDIADFYAGPLDDTKALGHFLLTELRTIAEDPLHPCGIWCFHHSSEVCKLSITDAPDKLPQYIGAGAKVFTQWADRLLFLKPETGCYYLLKADSHAHKLGWRTGTGDKETAASILAYEKTKGCWRETSTEDLGKRPFKSGSSVDFATGARIPYWTAQKDVRCNVCSGTENKDGTK